MAAAAEARLRSNPQYELVVLDRLATAERDLIDGDPDLYGVLRPYPGTELTPRAVSAATALLFLTLNEPAPIPAYVRVRLGEDTEATIARLVLDGVLEIECAGDFVSGARAGEILRLGTSDAGQGRIGALSRAAGLYGQELAVGGLPEDPLGLRLYSYGRRPVTASLAARLGEPAALEAHLGIDAAGPARAALDAHWVSTTAPEPAYWRSWRPRRSAHEDPTVHSFYKLYVSPDLDTVGVACTVVATTLARMRGVTGFKVGGDLDGLCRPDKLVVYFERLDDLHAGAGVVRTRLDGCPAHGVPFTAAITRDGLLSFGADPPASDEARTSWRRWVSRRLAEYLVAGVGHPQPWQFALARLRLAGVDTDSWIPPSGLWETARACA
jgi:hypothetical protein